jgi:L-alanine-DL-glutamate epimerase-like enolase superfamily enzyme
MVQIAHVKVLPITFKLRFPFRTARSLEVDETTAIFLRVETRQGRVAWGCTAIDPSATDERPEKVVEACRLGAERARDLNPLNTEFALAELGRLLADVPAALCAFDIAFHDLLGLAAGLPLYRLLGGYRHRIQTSITLSLAPNKETVEMARRRAKEGFRILKLKSSPDPEEDVRRVLAVHDALPGLALRLDAEQSYTVQQALDVARALEGKLEMLEQPTPADDLDALREVTRRSPVPVLADESATRPTAALEVAGRRAAHGLSVKLAVCGGLHCARQMDAIARAARMATMVSCVNEPALLIAAGLGFALSSPNVRYGDLDGHFDLLNDPTVPGFAFEDGWLVATDVPGLGCAVEM